MDQLEAKSPFAFELGLLVEAFFGNDEEVAVGYLKCSPTRDAPHQVVERFQPYTVYTCYGV